MILIWDPLVRIVHWSLVGIFVSNRFVNESGGLWHERLGYAACALIGVRILWGFIGSPYSRFRAHFSVWPDRSNRLDHFLRYLRGRDQRYLNHPPLALLTMGLMIFCILSLGMSGWMMGWDRYFGEEWLVVLHEQAGNGLTVLVVLHVIGILRESWIHRENLIFSMIHGKKRKEDQG